MPLRNIKSTQREQFDNAAELRDWLNQFSTTDLHGVLFRHGDLDHLEIIWETEVLSDGSEVNNITIPNAPSMEEGEERACAIRLHNLGSDSAPSQWPA